MRIDGAGRTDAGVHAWEQVAAFTSDTRIPGERWAQILNYYLPQDIHIQESSEIPETFHPRFSPHTKTYLYQIYQGNKGKSIYQRYACCIKFQLDETVMQRACKDLVGEHDFRAFCATRSSVKQYVRKVIQCELVKEDDWIRLFIQANGFLYNMVRIIAGTLIDVGRGRLPEDVFQKMLQTGKRSLGGKTAPPQGLALYRIQYEDEEKIVDNEPMKNYTN